METNEERLPSTDAHEQILEMEERIDEELSKGEQADMHLIDAYFRRIRELDGGVYEKSEEEVSRELKALYAKARRRQRRKRVGSFTDSRHSVAQRAASILIFVGIFGGLSAGVYAAREPIVNFLSNVYDNHIEIFFDENDVEKAPSKIETVYTLGYVPDGYMQETTFLNEVRSSITWVNDKNDRIVFRQTLLDGVLSLDNEHSVLGTTVMNEMTIMYQFTQHSRSYFWNTNEYQFTLDVPTEISYETALVMIDSMTKSN